MRNSVLYLAMLGDEHRSNDRAEKCDKFYKKKE